MQYEITPTDAILASEIHPWQVLGLGPAPFECIDVVTTNSSHEHECSTGACLVCGTKLIHNYVIQAANGRVFPVGCECVLVLDDNDRQLVDAVAAKHKEHEAAMRAARLAAKAGPALVTWAAAHPALFDLLEANREHKTLGKLFLALTKKGSLTARQHQLAVDTAAVVEAETAFKANNPGHGHEPAVGAVIDVVGRIVAQIKCARGGSMTLMHTPDGLEVKSFEIPYMPTISRVFLRAKVKEHQFYKGAKQIRVSIGEYGTLPDRIEGFSAYRTSAA
jgi:hypothetical protein